MTDKELADKVVALGVGWSEVLNGTTLYALDSPPSFEGKGMAAEQFVRDWRVAGALIEKCPIVIQEGEHVTVGIHNEKGQISNYGYATFVAGDRVRAIIEACVEGLEGQP